MSLTFIGLVAGVVAASCYIEHVKKEYAKKKEYIKKEDIKLDRSSISKSNELLEETKKNLKIYENKKQ